MSRPTHYTLEKKMKAYPNKPYKALKAKQKARISEWMFEGVCAFYRENGRMPEETELEPIAQQVYARLQRDIIWVQYASFYAVFQKKQKKFGERIAVHGLPEPKPPKVKKTEQEKKAIRRERLRQKRQKKAEAAECKAFEETYQDDYFYFIAGYTSGGAPYGVTWEEMGLEPWEDPENPGSGDAETVELPF